MMSGALDLLKLHKFSGKSRSLVFFLSAPIREIRG
jgi:hypothetical protein